MARWSGSGDRFRCTGQATSKGWPVNQSKVMTVRFTVPAFIHSYPSLT